MIVACQVIDPGSIPGERTLLLLLLFVLFMDLENNTTQTNKTTHTTLTYAQSSKEAKSVENQGIDPCASRMLSVRSTI